jgi:uncharacterized Zn finger protein
MAWTEGVIKHQGADVIISKNNSSDTFQMPIEVSLKVGDSFDFEKKNYVINSITNSRDEFYTVLADANNQPKPEGKKEDDKSKEG